MGSKIIADSSGLVSLLSKNDSNHHAAKKLISQLQLKNSTLVIPSEIFSETLNVLGKIIKHSVAAQIFMHITQQEGVLIEDTNKKIRSQALEKFSGSSQSLSFTDCVVMATANEFETKLVFGFDEHFKKSGYIRIGIDKK